MTRKTMLATFLAYPVLIVAWFLVMIRRSGGGVDRDYHDSTLDYLVSAITGTYTIAFTCSSVWFWSIVGVLMLGAWGLTIAKYSLMSHSSRRAGSACTLNAQSIMGGDHEGVDGGPRLKFKGASSAMQVMSAPHLGQRGLGVSGSLGTGSSSSPQSRARTSRRVLRAAPASHP